MWFQRNVSPSNECFASRVGQGVAPHGRACLDLLLLRYRRRTEPLVQQRLKQFSRERAQLIDRALRRPRTRATSFIVAA